MVEDVSVRPIGKGDWEHIEQLFGPNGGCGGCWCMLWRVPSTGKYWAEHKGASNRAALRDLVRSGKAKGLLALSGRDPVGWCSVGPRSDFAYFGRARKIDDVNADDTWSVTCFFIARHARRRGLAGKLLQGACDLAASKGASWLEGFPVKPAGRGRVPEAFAHTGVPAIFELAGFSPVADLGGRLHFRRSLSESS